jgi:hypothetical protein
MTDILEQAVVASEPVTATANPFCRQRAWFPRLVVGIAALVSALIRLPFLHAPISGDEGGYAAIAQWWSRGALLYRDALVDRPQLLMLLYRFANWISPRNVLGIRLVALAFGVATALLMALLATRLTNRLATGAAVAMVYAVVGSSPALEAFSAYGELLAGVPTLASLVLFVVWWRAGTGRWWLLAWAGVLGASAVLIKQSGFDGLLTIAAALLWFGVVRGDARKRRGLLVFVGGSAVPIGMSIVHGVSVGFLNYWNAIAGYRLRYLSAVDGSTGERFRLLRGSINRLGPLLLALVVLAIYGLKRSSRPVRLLVTVWFGWTLVGFVAGGLFWLHYFMGPVLPLCLLAGIGVHELVTPMRRAVGIGRVAWRLGVIALAFSLVLSQNLAAGRLGRSSDGRETVLELDHRHKLVADYVRAHTKPGDRVQGLWQSGPVSWYSDRLPVSRFLWATWFASFPGALPELAAQLSAPNAPVYVVAIHPISIIPAAGIVQDALNAHYILETTIEDVPIWRHRPVSAG